jgi:hypothetical protein
VPDLYTLAFLSRPRRVLDKTYVVVWDCANHEAQVLFKGEGEEVWQQVAQPFTRELDAHEYINNLSTLAKRDNNWREIE